MTTGAGQLTNLERRATRERLVELLRSDLIGPSLGPEEMLPERPDKRYLMGILFPREAMAMHVVAEEETASSITVITNWTATLR